MIIFVHFKFITKNLLRKESDKSYFDYPKYVFTYRILLTRAREKDKSDSFVQKLSPIINILTCLGKIINIHKK
jgi:hypothetical protein